MLSRNAFTMMLWASVRDPPAGILLPNGLRRLFVKSNVILPNSNSASGFFEMCISIYHVAFNRQIGVFFTLPHQAGTMLL